MKTLQIVGIALAGCGVICLGIALALRSDEPSIAPMLVGVTGGFDILLGAVLFFVGKRVPNVLINRPAEGSRERNARP